MPANGDVDCLGTVNILRYRFEYVKHRKSSELHSSAIGDYNRNVVQANRRRNLPDFDRLSVLAAALLLAYAMVHFVDLPAQSFDFQLPGLYINISLDFQTAVAFIAAGMTASGADWLVRDHPALKSGKTIQHWLLPALTAWVIGIPLFQLPFGLTWWAVFVVGGVLLLLVLVAEYIAVDTEDVWYPVAAAGLTSVSFALFLVLAIVLRSAQFRLFLLLPALAFALWLVSLRTLHLRLHGEWRLLEASLVAFVVGQLVTAFHYWPLSPVAFGLAVLGPAYALTSLIGGLAEGENLQQALLEPGFVLAALWGAAHFSR
jgi:hypothetical protein